MQADLPVQQVVAGLQDGAVGQLQVSQAVIRRREHHCRRRRRRKFLLRRLRGLFCWFFRGPSSPSLCRPPFLCGRALQGPCRPLASRLSFLSRLPASGFFCCDGEHRPPRQRCHQQGADAALRSAQLQLVSAPILLHVQALRGVTTAVRTRVGCMAWCVHVVPHRHHDFQQRLTLFWLCDAPEPRNATSSTRHRHPGVDRSIGITKRVRTQQPHV